LIGAASSVNDCFAFKRNGKGWWSGVWSMRFLVPHLLL